MDLTHFQSVQAALTGCTHVIHCGAIPSPIDGRETDVLASNAQGTWNILQGCVSHGISRAVVFSSVNAFGSFSGRRPLAYLPGDDAYPVHTHNAYQLAKHLVETTAQHYSRMHNIDIALLRPVYVAAAKAYSVWKSNEDTTPNIWSISDLWSYVDLRDVVSAAILAATVPFSGCHAMLLAAADTTSKLPTAALLQRDYPEAVMTDRLTEWLTNGDAYRGLIDCSAARNAIGWEPQYSWRSE
jgi:nucleoside-diphosphate-sugar epimerase